MDRSSLRYGSLAAILLGALLLCGNGCMGLMTTIMYMYKGNDVDPDFDGLKGQKVVVVCRPLASLQYRNSNVARDLATAVGLLLKTKVSKIQVIDQRKVDEYSDKHDWEDYVEVGKALKADRVVAIDLESFSIYQGQTLYQGKANAAVMVYDCKKEGEPLFKRDLPQTVWPPNASIPASERQEAQFRRDFIAVLADQIGRHFYAHDRHADLAQDNDALR